MIPSIISPVPSVIPDIVGRPSHFAITSPVPSMMVASMDPPPSLGSIRMFWMTPATLNLFRASKSAIGVVSARESRHERRVSARTSSGGREMFSKARHIPATMAKYGSIARVLSDGWLRSSDRCTS